MRLLPILAAFVVLYHGLNLMGRQWFSPKRHWVKSTIEVKRGVVTLEIPWISSWEKSPTYPDYASKWVRDLGYIFRYRVGQIPDFIIENKAQLPHELYEREEISTLDTGELPGLLKASQSINSVIQAWRSRNVEVVFIPVPSKLAVMRERLQSTLPPCAVFESCKAPPEHQGGQVYTRFAGSVVNAVDILADFRRIYHAGKRAFLADDSHWSSQGIAQAALRALNQLRPGEPWAIKPTGQILDYHFSSEYFQLPRWFLERSKRFKSEEVLYTIAPRVFERGRVIVLGTSFCQRLAHTEYGLGRLIAGGLGRELLQYCTPGGGVWGALREFEKVHGAPEPGDIVVWEVPLMHVIRAAQSHVVK